MEKRKQGFATMSLERRREIAAMGGKAVQSQNRYYSVNRKAAVDAGRKGGANVPLEKRTFRRFPDLAKRAYQARGARKPKLEALQSNEP